MNDSALIALAAIAAVAAVAAAVAAVLALVRSTSSQRAAEAALSELRQGVAELMRNATAENAAGRQRYETLVREISSTASKGDALRQEVGRQLEQSRASRDARLDRVSETNRTALSDMRSSVDRQLGEIRSDTNAQLDRMRATVDEKLQKTLDERIARSFELVNKQLTEVSRGLGEMQGLAADVGGLKRALAGVKTRGILGEIQLGAILQEILSPAQYETNVATVPGSDERVEFAIKLPGEDGETVWLPIDSKFPGDAYEHLRDAAEAGDATAVEAAWKALESRIKREARDISDKYLAPPATTTFGILFLPFEGLYAEVASRPGLLEELQRTHHVSVAGPSTMAALLNSLQMGFQTVAIQRRAAEIQRVLAAVKTEFGKYHASLIKARRQLNTVGKTVDELLGARTNKMNKALSGIVELESLDEADRVLGVEEAEAPGAPGAAGETDTAFEDADGAPHDDESEE